ncbi:DUF4136 domain-containing protein [Mucilaginibacter litoreus]|uniref:DUF4136 domain-containing protein n=1 Tax=Mucilaginibacter litoreus TaxID=1048221 RepID=A0ABW3AWF3_9SPHI
MVRKFKTLFTVVLLSATSCATSYKLANSDFDKTVDFSKYKTFSWIAPLDKDSISAADQIIYNNTINYFAHDLAARGMTVDNDNPDLLFQLKVSEKREQRTETARQTFPLYNNNYYFRYHAFSPYNRYYNLYPRSYYYNRGFNFNDYRYGYNTQTGDYTKSSLTLNVMDLKQRKFIYTATVEADLYDPATWKRELHPAVHTLLDNYPVKATAKK